MQLLLKLIFEASGISVGENPPLELTLELFLDSGQETNSATDVSQLALDRF